MVKSLALIHSNSNILLNAAQTLISCNFTVFACHDIDAAHAVIDHENITCLILDFIHEPHISLWNERVLKHLKAYHPLLTITFADLGKPEDLAQALVKSGLKADSMLNPPQAQLFHMKQLDYFIHENPIKAVFQPIVSLISSRPTVFAMEALSRMRWPLQEAHINPEMLFSYASNEGRLLELDMACMQAAFSQLNNLAIVKCLFINVRPLTITHPAFLTRAIELRKSLPHCQIVFELTEHETLPNLNVLVHAAQSLKALDFELAIDDFGKGYANLNLLCALQPAFIKLSGSFAENLAKNQRARIIVKTITHLANELGIRVILENIESENCAQEALALGIHYAQGYHYGKPSELPITLS